MIDNESVCILRMPQMVCVNPWQLATGELIVLTTTVDSVLRVKRHTTVICECH